MFSLIGGFSVCFMKLGAAVFGTYVYNFNILLADCSLKDYEVAFKISPDQFWLQVYFCLAVDSCVCLLHSFGVPSSILSPWDHVSSLMVKCIS